MRALRSALTSPARPSVAQTRSTNSTSWIASYDCVCTRCIKAIEKYLHSLLSAMSLSCTHNTLRGPAWPCVMSQSFLPPIMLFQLLMRKHRMLLSYFLDLLLLQQCSAQCFDRYVETTGFIARVLAQRMNREIQAANSSGSSLLN